LLPYVVQCDMQIKSCAYFVAQYAAADMGSVAADMGSAELVARLVAWCVLPLGDMLTVRIWI
jgi:hypothetical protein